MSRLKIFFLAVFLLTVGYGVSMASDPMGNIPVMDRKFKGFSPMGFRLGKFQVYTNIDALGGYTSNALQASQDEVSDKILTTVGSINADAGFGRLNLDVGGGISRTDYQDIDAFDRSDFWGRVQGQYDLSSVVGLSVGVEKKRSHETRFDNATLQGVYEPIQVDEEGIKARLSLKPAGFRWDLIGQYRTLRYKDTQLYGGGSSLVQKDRDRDSYSAQVKVSHGDYAGPNGSRLIPFLGFSFSRDVYKHRNYVVATSDFTGNDQDVTRYNLSAGVDIQPTGKLRGTMSVGYGLSKPDDTSADDTGDVTARIDLSYLYSPLTNLFFNVNRFFSGDEQSSQVNFETQLSAGVIHELTRQWILNAGATYTMRDYNDGLKDNTWDITTGVMYRVNENVSLGGDLQFISRESERANGDYDETRAMIRLKTKF